MKNKKYCSRYKKKATKKWRVYYACGKWF